MRRWRMKRSCCGRPARAGVSTHRWCACARRRDSPPRVVQEAHGMHAVLSLVAVEAGISVVPASMAGFLEAEVVYRPISGDAAAFELHLCLRAGEASPAVVNFARNVAG